MNTLIRTRQQLSRHIKNKKTAHNELTHKPIEEKESYRWLLGYRKGCEIASLCSTTQCVVVGNRECDIYDVFHGCEHKKHSIKADWLVRILHNRVIVDEQGEREAEKLYAKLEASPIIANVEFDMAKQGARKARHVKQSIQVQTVTLHPPTGRRGAMLLNPMSVTVLIAKELEPPRGEKPICWRLMSNIVFEKSEQALKLIQWYLCRWEIEIYFKLLKSGCQLEKIQLTGE